MLALLCVFDAAYACEEQIEAEVQMQRYDINNVGYAIVEDFIRVQREYNEDPRATKIATESFKSIDKNNDKKVTFKEIQKSIDDYYRKCYEAMTSPPDS